MYRIIDDDGNRSINMEEFAKICKDLRVGFSKEEVEQLYGIFDRDGSGLIDYDEFLRAIRGEMNKGRLNLVLAVFSKLDRNRNGVIEVDDITGNLECIHSSLSTITLSPLVGIYSAREHPDVINGKKTEEEVLGDFLDTFE